MLQRVLQAGLSGLALVAFVACANGDDVGVDADPESVKEADAGGDKTHTPLPEAGAPSAPRPDDDDIIVPDDDDPDDSGDDKDPGDTTCTGSVVVNELMPQGAGGAEFIELYNPNGCAVALSGWKLLYQSKGGGDGPSFYTFTAQDSISAKAFFVLGNAAFSGKKDRAFAGNANIGNTGGQVGLVDASGKIVDGIGYGPTTGGKYVEKNPVALPSPGSSVGRKIDGVDTGNNATDCKVFASPTPGAPN